MKNVFSLSEKTELAPELPPSVEALLERLQEIDPAEMASALCNLEFHNQLQGFQIKSPHFQFDETQLYLSRGLKDEVEKIYLDLARHLKARSDGANQLLDAVFELFTRTLTSLMQVSRFISNN